MATFTSHRIISGFLLAFFSLFSISAGELAVSEISPFNWQPLGICRGATVDGDTVYLSIGGGGVLVFDISVAANPRLVGRLDTTGTAYGSAIAGDKLYLASETAGLQILDVSAPALPRLIGSIDTPGTAVGVVVAGSTAFVADSRSGVQVIDISNPANPVMVSGYDTTGSAVSLAITGQTLFVADTDGGLLLLDISDPANLRRIGSYASPCTDVVVAGPNVFLACGAQGVHSVNVADPTSPVRIGLLASIRTAKALDLRGETLYVADDVAGLRVVDAANPASMVLLGTVAPAEGVQGVAVHASSVIGFVTNRMQVFDVSTPSSPAKIAQFITQLDARGLALRDNVAFVADLRQGLQTVDISDPHNPILLGSHLTTARSVEVSGNLAFVAAFAEGFQVIDVSNPARPTLRASLSTLDNFYDIVPSTGIVYAAEGTRGLNVIDVSNPANPISIGRADTSGSAFDLVIENSIAYIADGDNGLVTVNVSNPRNPVIIHGGWPGSPYRGAYSVAKKGDYVFISSRTGVRIFNVANPAITYPIWQQPGAPIVQAFSLHENRLTVAVGTLTPAPIEVWDLSIPLEPLRIASFQSRSYPGTFRARGQTMFVADGPGSLRILQLDSAPAVIARPIVSRARGETLAIGWRSENMTAPQWRITWTKPDGGSLDLPQPVSDGFGNWQTSVAIPLSTEVSCEHRIRIEDTASDAFSLPTFCIHADPPLTISVQDSILRVEWPNQFLNYSLQQRATFSSAWEPVPGGVFFGPGIFFIEITDPGFRNFYRLQR